MTNPSLTKLYYSIAEVSKIVDLAPHVLRYWESQFAQLKPKRMGTGRRHYRPGDIKLILLIKHLLYEEGYTLEGAKKRLNGMKRFPTSQLDFPFEEAKLRETLRMVKEELKEILAII